MVDAAAAFVVILKGGPSFKFKKAKSKDRTNIESPRPANK